jgi:hypothetical protein
MSPVPARVHLNNHHRDTLSEIFQHPVGHNIEWRAVISLLNFVATVDENDDGSVLVTLGNETETFQRPRHKDIDAQTVVDLRRMFENAGYGSGVVSGETEINDS